MMLLLAHAFAKPLLLYYRALKIFRKKFIIFNCGFVNSFCSNSKLLPKRAQHTTEPQSYKTNNVKQLTNVKGAQSLSSPGSVTLGVGIKILI